MNIIKFVEDFIAISNAYDINSFLDKWKKDAVLDDPSVGQKFNGYDGIRNYFENYFIGYNTQTELVKLNIINESQAHIEVAFTGNFPEGNIGGTFDFTFEDDKILFAKAALI